VGFEHGHPAPPPIPPTLSPLAATNLVAAGIDPKTAQARLGHSSPQMTIGIYARATAEGDRNAANKIGEMIGRRDARERRSQPDGEKETRL
jgi:integrase